MSTLPHDLVLAAIQATRQAVESLDPRATALGAQLVWVVQDDAARHRWEVKIPYVRNLEWTLREPPVRLKRSHFTHEGRDISVHCFDLGAREDRVAPFERPALDIALSPIYEQTRGFEQMASSIHLSLGWLALATIAALGNDAVTVEDRCVIQQMIGRLVKVSADDRPTFKFNAVRTLEAARSETPTPAMFRRMVKAAAENRVATYATCSFEVHQTILNPPRWDWGRLGHGCLPLLPEGVASVTPWHVRHKEVLEAWDRALLPSPVATLPPSPWHASREIDELSLG